MEHVKAKNSNVVHFVSLIGGGDSTLCGYAVDGDRCIGLAPMTPTGQKVTCPYCLMTGRACKSVSAKELGKPIDDMD